jgi:CDP-diacylglycerol--glycerol-3-phosphate 3-phosphatidyltransferase
VASEATGGARIKGRAGEGAPVSFEASLPPRMSDLSSRPAGRRRPSSGRLPHLGRFWTWPNAITLSRLVLVPPIAWLVYHDGPITWLLALVLVALATDFLDGFVARRTGTVSEWGKVLDPLVDKVAAAAVVLALLLRPTPPTLELWFVLLVLIRDVTIAAGGVLQTRKLGFVLMAMWSGKVAVNLLALTVIAVLLRAPAMLIQVLMWFTAAVLVLSWGQYFYRFVQVMRLGPAVPLDEHHNVRRERFSLRPQQEE